MALLRVVKGHLQSPGSRSLEKSMAVKSLLEICCFLHFSPSYLASRGTGHKGCCDTSAFGKRLSLGDNLFLMLHFVIGNLQSDYV